MPLKIQKFTFFPEMFAENTYVISDGLDCAVIDPGCFHAHERKSLADFIEQAGLKVKYILNTHLHIDHVMGNRFVSQKYGVPILAHQMDLFNLERVGEFVRAWNLPDPDSPIPDRWLEEGDEIWIGETQLDVLFVPGHSPGHIAFFDRVGLNLFSGDVVFQGSIGRTDLPGGDYDTLMNTIQEKILTLPDETRIFAGHMGVTNVGHERRTNPFLTT